ncbi:MAG: MFS transporter [Dehalococcoidia bacterium]
MQLDASKLRGFGKYPYALGVVVLFVQVALGILLFATFQEWIPSELGAGDQWGGYLLAAYGGSRFLFEAPTGAISDHMERRIGILFGFALMLPAILLMGLARDERAFLAFSSMLGFATAFFWPATYAMSADLYPPERRGKVIGFLNVAQLLGFGIGALSGAFLVLGPSSAQFIVAGSAIVLAFLVGVTTLPGYRQVLRPVSHASRPGLREIASFRLAWLSSIVLASSIGVAMVVPAIRPFGENDLGVSFERLTLALVPAVVVGAALYVPAGHLADRYGRTLPMIAGQFLIVCGLLIAASTGSVFVAAGAAVILFAGNVMTVPALNAAVMDLAPESHRGSLIGLSVALNGLGLAMGPALGGILVGQWGAPGAFRVAAGICAGTGLSVALYRRSHPRLVVPAPVRDAI